MGRCHDASCSIYGRPDQGTADTRAHDFRPEFEPPWAGLPNVSLLRLDRLDRQDTRALVEQVTVGRHLPAEMMTQIIDRTDGIPLFVEELTKMVLSPDCWWKTPGAIASIVRCRRSPFPATLQDLLMARLDRLAPVGGGADRRCHRPRLLIHALLRMWRGAMI